MNCLPILAAVAHIYLDTPLASIPSERLLSVTDEVLNHYGSLLLPDHATQLMFLKENSKRIKKKTELLSIL